MAQLSDDGRSLVPARLWPLGCRVTHRWCEDNIGSLQSRSAPPTCFMELEEPEASADGSFLPCQRAEEFVEVRGDRLAQGEEPDLGFVLLARLAVERLEDFLSRFRRAEHYEL
ncbi:MAG: hypothetical protein IAG10_00230 [Planctomycetaceae bacterium]|nr:hypothetical protein [Planctomycetaceae bacterium]